MNQVRRYSKNQVSREGFVDSTIENFDFEMETITS